MVTRCNCSGRDIRLLALAAAAAVWITLSMVGCSGDEQVASASTVASREIGETSNGAVVSVQTASSQQGASPRTPPRLIAHPENVQLGLAISDSQLTLTNPRENDPRALEEGKELFVSYNCADCHGDEGSGAMGPALDDGRWHFGGTAGEVFESISEGRPDGMPAWGGRISNAEIWALVRYVRTLSAGKDPTTENFEGATIQRTGH